MVSHMPTLLQGHANMIFLSVLISQSMNVLKDIGHPEMRNLVGFAKVKGGVFQLV